jgi:hypothetical protein
MKCILGPRESSKRLRPDQRIQLEGDHVHPDRLYRNDMEVGEMEGARYELRTADDLYSLY